MPSIRCLSLFSGGLDSMIAISLLKDQGIDVIALHLDIGFGSSDDNHEVLYKRAKLAGAPLEIIDIKEQFIQEILFAPQYGYGKNFNPCIDCHGNMFRVALGLLDKYDAHFIATGEVKGQRPMSQRSDALKVVEKLAFDENHLILRPLSAKTLSPTTPEQNGWVERERLWGLVGRNREKQLQYAKEKNWEDYQTPGGGCLLTEESYARKIKDVIAYKKFEIQDVLLLKIGRHMRLNEGSKLIICRNKEENDTLQSLDTKGYILLKANDITGPLGLLTLDASQAEKILSARMILTYTKWDVNTEGSVQVGEEVLKVYPFDSKEIAKEYLI